MSRAHVVLLASSLVVGACNKRPASAAAEAHPHPAGSRDMAPRASLQLQGPIELPDAVPAGATGVFVARVPDSLFASVVGADPLGLVAGDLSTIKADLDAYLRKELGVTITDATTVAAFFTDEDALGIVLTRVTGSINGSRVSTHGGVDIYTRRGGDRDVRFATTDDLLIIGTDKTVRDAIDAQTDPEKSMKHVDTMATLIAAHTEGAAVVVAFDATAAPRDFARGLPEPMKLLDQALVTFDGNSLKLVATGEADKLSRIATLVETRLEELATETEQAKQHATENQGNLLEGVAAILAAHYVRRANNVLKPKVEGQLLSIEMPIAVGDPAILAAIAGIGAAIAVPIFARSKQRAKTAEARVQLARMVDAAVAYFNEESATIVAVGAPPKAMPPHQCPNDGTLSGESGITPPLSLDCSAGPGGRCIPATATRGNPGYYDLKTWTDNPVWEALNFQQEQGHYFHYNFKYANGGEDFGQCQFTAQAFADLDGDGVFSTYERAGAADGNGAFLSAGLYIDQELE